MAHDHPTQLFTPPKLVTHLNDLEQAEKVAEIRESIEAVRHSAQMVSPENLIDLLDEIVDLMKRLL